MIGDLSLFPFFFLLSSVKDIVILRDRLFFFQPYGGLLALTRRRPPFPCFWLWTLKMMRWYGRSVVALSLSSPYRT